MQSSTLRTRQPPRSSNTTPPIGYCSICETTISVWDERARKVTFHDRTYYVCGTCRKNYQDPCRQIALSGFTYRFVKRSEIPRNERTTRCFAEVYKTLLLVNEQGQLRQKEVKDMVGDKTTKIVTLHERIGRVLCDTYTVLGDEFKIEDNEALVRIRDMIEEIDPQIINKLMKERDRKRKKRLP